MANATKFTAFLSMLLIVFLTHAGFAGDEWWQKAKQEKESPTRYAYEGTVSNSPVRALADFENQYLEFEASGTVDMSTVVNQPQAEIQAKEAATVRAYAEAARFVAGMLVKAVYSVQGGILKDSDIAAKIEATMVKYAREVDDKVEWRGGAPLATVKIGMLFQNRNGLLETVMPYIDQGVKDAGITSYQAPGKSAENSGYTGLIIDARHLSVSPSIAPMILTGGDNKQVYGNLKVGRDFAVERGIAGYYATLEAAKADTDRLGANPMVIKAEKTAVSDAHLWINESDATKLYYADLNNGFLKECRVGIVIK